MEPTLPPDAEETTLGIAFLDLARFARWAELWDDREAAGLLQGFYDLTARRIEPAGGRIVKTIGDAVMFVFEPERCQDVVEALHTLAGEVVSGAEARGLHTRLDAKVHVGPVVAGAFGPPGLERYDVFGRTVNDAARLRGEGIVLSPTVAERLA